MESYDQSNSVVIINNEAMQITTKTELNKAIKSLRANFIELQENQPPNSEVESIEQPIKKSIKGRPKKEESEKKIYDKHYFNDYYHKKLNIEIICNNCGRYVTKGNMSKHMKTDFCKNHPIGNNDSIVDIYFVNVLN